MPRGVLQEPLIAEELKRKHVEIFTYVMGSVDTARRRTVRQAAIEDVFPENEFRWCAWVDAAALGSGELDWHSQKMLADGRDAELVERLLQAPYTGTRGSGPAARRDRIVHTGQLPASVNEWGSS
jgi:hypothetical protein